MCDETVVNDSIVHYHDNETHFSYLSLLGRAIYFEFDYDCEYVTIDARFSLTKMKRRSF